MATIINTLEVIVEEPKVAPAQPAVTAPQPAAAPALRPLDLDDIDERRLRQTARRTAH